MLGVFSRLIFLSCLFAAHTAMPAGGAQHSNEIPWNLIFAQTFNFFVFVIILGYLVKKFLAPVFPQFRQDYLTEANKAQEIMAEAQKQKREIEDRLNSLETTYSSRLAKAKQDSLQLKEKMISDSREKAEKVLTEASESAMALFKSNERKFKMMVLDQAIADAREELSKSMDDKQMQKLHGEFLEEIRMNP